MLSTNVAAEEMLVEPNAITEESLTELSILREKIEVVLDCVIDDTDARNQTLTYIATDYLAAMKTQLQAMQERMLMAE